MAKACSEALTPAAAESLIQTLSEDSKLVYHCGLTPAKLPALVEHNPMIAIECLLRLTPSSQFTE